MNSYDDIKVHRLSNELTKRQSELVNLPNEIENLYLFSHEETNKILYYSILCLCRISVSFRKHH